MAEPDAGRAEARYKAFISYSHADDGFANWLHRRLEGFALPAPGDAGTAQLAPVFIDRAELVAAPDLSRQVQEALADSAALIVVCSPAAAASRWVGQEVELFRQLHPGRPILAALIDGEPDAAFPRALTHDNGRIVEPLAADFRRQGDGRRLALLKIVAGLSGLPLDRLVQRDAQKRQRRVMAVTAAAVTLSVILSALLVMAIRERTEARRQRAEAEGMVEFMLTDLREKLKGVGRLEIMDSVNRKAMEHYQADRNLEILPADILLRRVRLLTAMGEDDFDAGKMDTAKREFAAAYQVTATLLKQAPNDPERIFNHAQSEYWVGAIPFKARDKAATQPHFNAYLLLAKQLVALEPGKTAWQREVGYAENNLCALAQTAPVQIGLARQHCREAVRITDILSRREPKSLPSQLDHLNNLGWQADTERKAGNAEDALAIRLRQRDIAATLPARFPEDIRAEQANVQVLLGLAQTYAATGRRMQSRQTARDALAIADRLRARDPSNASWDNWRKQLVELARDG